MILKFYIPTYFYITRNSQTWVLGVGIPTASFSHSQWYCQPYYMYILYLWHKLSSHLLSHIRNIIKNLICHTHYCLIKKKVIKLFCWYYIIFPWFNCPHSYRLPCYLSINYLIYYELESTLGYNNKFSYEGILGYCVLDLVS